MHDAVGRVGMIFEIGGRRHSMMVIYLMLPAYQLRERDFEELDCCVLSRLLAVVFKIPCRERTVSQGRAVSL